LRALISRVHANEITMASFDFRFVVPADLALLREWHRRAHVLEWWPEPPSEQDLKDLCACGADLASRFYIALLAGAPAGFIQSYSPVEGHAEGWWLDEHDPGVRGIDQFLANPEQLNSGLGTQMTQDFVAMLFADPTVTRIQVDPQPHNARAIRCYEKAGFRAAREVVTPDGPAVLMYLDKTHGPAISRLANRRPGEP
jgi:RimJ/RimL family protein N-acetyltransferase